MRAVAQRVFEASVVVGDEVTGAIGPGLLVYLGASSDDGPGDVDAMVGKIAGLRIFTDEEGKMARSVEDVRGAVLVVSQFTLFGDVRRGRRPSFTGAAEPARAEALYEEVVRGLAARGLEVATGRFRATMEVRSRGDGPVTILIDTHKAF
ncbi:MAG: D-tyrosyl-tRNA(Tyr) deacylase [Sandaracinaceae bacterium]|nr:D-tyrosyl-tRNA(Tyr) deacylase [Sandaracinaceae bacterium]